MIWHLIKTGHRPKHGADVVCLFYDGEAIECHYDRSDDTFIPYDQRWDMQPFKANDFKAWSFTPNHIFNIRDSYEDFLLFSSTHEFPPLKEKSKEAKQ